MLNPNLFFKGGKSTHLFRTKNWGTSFYQKWCFLQSFDLKELEKTSTIKVIGSGVQVLPPTYKSRTRSIYCADDSHSVRNHYFIIKPNKEILCDSTLCLWPLISTFWTDVMPKTLFWSFLYPLNILATWQSYNNFHWFYSCCGGRFILGRNIIWIMGWNTSGKEETATKGTVSN